MAAAPTRRDIHHQVLGGRFRFRSDSPALLDIVDAAYAGLPPHRFGSEPPRFEIDLQLRPGAHPSPPEPPPVRIRAGPARVLGVMDHRNHVHVSHRQRRASVVAGAELLVHRYHLRYELIEFAVFLLAARAQGLVPLHGACVARKGRGVLLLGESGAGKSTLTLHALLAGFELVAEDAVFVRPDELLATGVPNFLHVRTDALDAIDDLSTRRWIAGAPVIRRSSGVEKFEADLRSAPAAARMAAAPVRLAAVVLLSAPQRAAEHPRMLRATHAEAMACLDAGQPHARTQPGWARFAQRLAGVPVLHLCRGARPADSVALLRDLLD